MGTGSIVLKGSNHASATTITLCPEDIKWTGKNELRLLNKYVSSSRASGTDPQTVAYNSKDITESFKITGTIPSGSPAAFNQVKDIRTLVRSGDFIWFYWDNLAGVLPDETHGSYTITSGNGNALTSCADWHLDPRPESFAWDYTIDLIISKPRG